MLVKGSPVELVRVGESLGPGALPDGDQPVLVWVQHPPLLPHWLGVGDGCRKETVILNSTIESSPLVVTVAGGRKRDRAHYEQNKKWPRFNEQVGQLLTWCEAGTRE